MKVFPEKYPSFLPSTTPFTHRGTFVVKAGFPKVFTFEVPKSWLEEKGYLTESIMLNTFENDNWKELPTTMVDETNTTITYKAELKHFSYFAITGKKASSNLTGAAITLLKNFSGALNGRVVVLFSFVMLILVLGMIYVKIRERDY